MICGSPHPPFQSKILATPMAGMLKFFAKDKRVNSGVARGWGGPPRMSPFCFFSFETENLLIGRQRPFFFWSSHTFGLKTEHQLVLQRRPFFFGVHVYFGR